MVTHAVKTWFNERCFVPVNWRVDYVYVLLYFISCEILYQIFIHHNDD